MSPFFVYIRINKTMKGILEEFRQAFEDSGLKPRSIESNAWFEEKIEEIRRPIDRKLLKAEVERERGILTPHVGRMYLFNYYPKGVLTLPYFDMFPVIFLVAIKKEYFQGINLHYLPLDIRREFFTAVMERTNIKEFNKQTYLRIDYDFLNSFRKYRAFKPCFKNYASDRVRGRVINVPSPEWELVMNLPVAHWRRSSEAKIHAENRKRYRNTI